MSHNLVPLACITASHIGMYNSRQTRPRKILCNESLSTSDAIVASKGGIMILLQDLQDKGFRGRRDKNASLRVEDVPLHAELIR